MLCLLVFVVDLVVGLWIIMDGLEQRLTKTFDLVVLKIESSATLFGNEGVVQLGVV